MGNIKIVEDKLQYELKLQKKKVKTLAENLEEQKKLTLQVEVTKDKYQRDLKDTFKLKDAEEKKMKA